MLETNLGVYRCGGVNFPSKIAACVHSERTGQPVEWWFHNETYQSFAWDVEPAETLDELYDRRARELREQYDYLVLSYSGGADSNNMVQSFVRQGLHIDEIVTNHMTRATKKTLVLDPTVKASWNFNAEHQLQALPRLNELRLALPRTKFTVLEVSDLVLHGLNQFQDAEWIMNRTEHLSVGQLFRYNYYHFAELRRTFDKNIRIGIVLGVDKPKTEIDADGNFWLNFVDGAVNIVSVNEFNADYTNIRTELFYWSPSTAALVAKQAHVLKRHLEQNVRHRTAWMTKSFVTARLVQERLLRNILYTTWNNNWYQADKSTNMMWTEFDQWFHREPEFARQQQQWQHGIEYLLKLIPKYVILGHQGRHSLRPFRHSYFIGKMAKLL